MASRLVLSLLLASSAAALDEQRLPPLPGAPAKYDAADRRADCATIRQRRVNLSGDGSRR